MSLFNSESPQEEFAKNTYNQLQGIQTPDLVSVYKSLAPNANAAFNPANINKYYDLALSNLNKQMGGMVGNAQSTAGALAASRGLANPSAFVRNSGNDVRSSFTPQFGNIEMGRAKGLSELDLNRYNALTDYARNYTGLLQNQFGNTMSKFGAGAGLGSYYDPASSKDKALGFTSGLIKAIPSVVSGAG